MAPPAPYILRPARVADIPRLPAIERAAAALFVEAGIGGTITVMPTEELEAARLEGRLLVAADADDQPVGFLVMAIIDGLAHLAEMDVHPAHGRRGLGSALLEAGVDQARQRGLPAMTLTTYAALPWNAPFYARRGFAVVPASEWTPAMAATAAHEGVTPDSGRVLMRRALS